MGYLEEFQTQINQRNFPKFLHLWEEYCTCDVVEVDELEFLLKTIKESEISKPFGKIVETALPMWEKIEDEESKYKIIKLLLDIQTTNSPKLANLALNEIQKRFPNDSLSNERLKLVGLRSKDNFQNALSNYDLLAHMAKGKFVFHTGGWGTGEIYEISSLREQVTLEFENVTGKKQLSFTNAFKTLIPLDNAKFLARRFSDPDKLEKDARENPVEIIKLLLKDLGPQNAAEIKDELCELVIPDADWAKWWQNARAKLKKDPIIESPTSLKEPFRLRKEEITSEEKIKSVLKNQKDINQFILSSYNFVRDLPNAKKNIEIKETLKEKLLETLSDIRITPEQELQIYIFLEHMFSHKATEKSAVSIIRILKNPTDLIDKIEIQAFKKRILALIRENREDWESLFLTVFLTPQQSPIRDYLLKELNQGETKKLLNEKLSKLLINPVESPETFVWYFQKLTNESDTDIPFNSKEGICQFFDGLLILLSSIESKPDYKELIKKIYNMLIAKRFQLVRQIIEGTSVIFLKEFLLLVSKCQTFSNHDLKILRSLAEVQQPSLIDATNKKSKYDENIIWTTESGYLHTQDRIRQIGTVEIIENAREVEAARALGDLRENSEYKFACEKRSRLQSELKALSDQLKKSRIITKEDIDVEEIGVGSIIDLIDSSGNKTTYTILGPWDANPDNHVLSFQSKFAQSMVGCHEGDTFKFRDEEYSVSKVKSFFA